MLKKRQIKSKRIKNGSDSDEYLDRASEAFEKIIDLTGEFCREHLTIEYLELCEDLTWAVYEEGLPLQKGRPSSWASGIVHAIGWVNFLHDPAQTPHMTSAQLAEKFGVSQQTMLGKSKIIRDELELIQLDPDWCLPSKLKDNPFVWMLEVDGFIVDARNAPREFQQEAFRLGLIPYIPADRQRPELKPETETKIIKFPSGHKITPSPESTPKSKDDEPNLFERFPEQGTTNIECPGKKQ